MGVLMPSSILMLWKVGKAERGVRQAERGMAESSEGKGGKVGMMGVLSWASFGRAECGRVVVVAMVSSFVECLCGEIEGEDSRWR